jgi:hypothetical protein
LNVPFFHGPQPSIDNPSGDPDRGCQGGHLLRRGRRTIYHYDPGLPGSCRYRYLDIRGQLRTEVYEVRKLSLSWEEESGNSE